MSRLTLVPILTLITLPGLVAAQSVPTGEPLGPLPRLQARVGLSTVPPTDGQAASWQQQAGVVLGDYYFNRARFGSADVSSGFRATSGLWLGPRSVALGTPALPGQQGLAMTSLTRQSRALELAPEPWSAVPYLGVGWSGASLRGGWGMTADFGFAARPATGLRATANQGLDDLLRELRLTPVLHVGVSYAF